MKIIGYASAVYEAYPAYPSTCVAILQCIAIRACLTVASFCCSRASTAENRQWSVQVRIGNGVSIDVRTTDRPKTASRPKFDEDDERAQSPGAHDAPSSGVPGSSNDGPGGVARAPSERSEGSSEVPHARPVPRRRAPPQQSADGVWISTSQGYAFHKIGCGKLNQSAYANLMDAKTALE